MFRLARLGSFDYVVIEASGVAEPLPIAETFTFEDKDDGTVVKDLAMVDTMVGPLLTVLPTSLSPQPPASVRVPVIRSLS